MKTKVVTLAVALLATSISYGQKNVENDKNINVLLKELVTEYLSQSGTQNAGWNYPSEQTDVQTLSPNSNTPTTESTLKDMVRDAMNELEAEKKKPKSEEKPQITKEMIMQILRESQSETPANNSFSNTNIQDYNYPNIATISDGTRVNNAALYYDQESYSEADYEEVSFPEGFVMKLPVDTYIINKEGNRYTFRLKSNPSQEGDFEVILSKQNPQPLLTKQNHFTVSRNKNLGLYGIYANNEITQKANILGFRLFYTIPLGENIYATAISTVFGSYEQYDEYVDDLISLKRSNTGSSINYTMYDNTANSLR